VKNYAKYGTAFETTMLGLTEPNKQEIKRILDIQELCYYRRNKKNLLELICI